MYMKDGPYDFVKYCEKWEESATINGNTIINKDLYKAVTRYAELYALENPNLDDIDRLIEFVDTGDIGSIKTDLSASIRRWKKRLMNKGD